MTPIPVCRHCGKPIHTGLFGVWVHPNGYAGCARPRAVFSVTHAEPAEQVEGGIQ
jgi:hypothetical protein